MAMTLVEWSARINSMTDALSVPDGGFSVDPRDGSDIRVGYVVAVHPEHERVFDRLVTVDDLIEYIVQTKDVLTLPGRVLGGWCDPHTGLVYLDVSVATTSLIKATHLAQRAQQIAIFDCAARSSIPLANAGQVSLYSLPISPSKEGAPM